MKAILMLMMLAVMAAGCGSEGTQKGADPNDHRGHNHAPGEGH